MWSPTGTVTVQATREDLLSRRRKAERVQKAIDQALAVQDDHVYVPDEIVRTGGYDASLVSFGGLKMVREGGNPSRLDVLAYGAAGDGETDDAAAFQAAVDVAQSQGAGHVHAPGRETPYAIDSTVVIDGAAFSLDGNHTGRFTISGDGRGVSKIIPGPNWSAGDTLFHFQGTTAIQVKEVEVKSLWINGEGKDADLLRLDWVTRSTFRDLLIRDTIGNGVHIVDGYDQLWDQVFFEYCGGDGTHFATLVEGAEATQDVNNLRFVTCRWERTGTRPGAGFFKVDGSGMVNGTARKFLFLGCKFHGWTDLADRSDRAHFIVNGLDQVDFVAPTSLTYASGPAGFFDLTNCKGWHFIGGTYSGSTDFDHMWELTDCENLSWIGVHCFTANVAYINAISGNFSLKTDETCVWGGSTTIVTGQTGQAFFQETIDNEKEVFGATKFSGWIGFYGASPSGKPDITGSRGGNAALADLLTKLETLGLITDSSS